jgi:hypothetical protein
LAERLLRLDLSIVERCGDRFSTLADAYGWVDPRVVRLSQRGARLNTCARRVGRAGEGVSACSSISTTGSTIEAVALRVLPHERLSLAGDV